MIAIKVALVTYAVWCVLYALAAFVRWLLGDE